VATTNETPDTMRKLTPYRELNGGRFVVTRRVIHDFSGNSNARITDKNASTCVSARARNEFFYLRVFLTAERAPKLFESDHIHYL